MKIRGCQQVLPVVLSLSFLVCLASEQKRTVSEADLKGFFKSIEFDGTNLVFTARRKFIYTINGKDEKDDRFCKPGETIVLSEKSELKVFERHVFLTFSPIKEAVGFKGLRVSVEEDFRSFRGNLSTNYAYMVYLDEKPDPSGEEKGSAALKANRAMVKSADAPEKAPEKKCLKGLTLLPCEDQ